MISLASIEAYNSQHQWRRRILHRGMSVSSKEDLEDHALNLVKQISFTCLKTYFNYRQLLLTDFHKLGTA